MQEIMALSVNENMSSQVEKQSGIHSQVVKFDMREYGILICPRFENNTSSTCEK